MILLLATGVVRSEQVFPNPSNCMLDRATKERIRGRHGRIKELASASSCPCGYKAALKLPLRKHHSPYRKIIKTRSRRYKAWERHSIITMSYNLLAGPDGFCE